MSVALTVGLSSAAVASPAPAGTGTLTVMLMTPAKVGLPMEHAGIYVKNENGVERTGSSDARGQAVITDLPAGSHWSIEAVQGGIVGVYERLPGVRTGVTVTAGVHSWVVVVMRYGGVIHGGVTDAAGLPVANAKVSATDQLTLRTTTTWTNASGRYSIEGLPKQRYAVAFTVGFHNPVTTVFADVDAQYGSNPETVLSIDATVTR